MPWYKRSCGTKHSLFYGLLRPFDGVTPYRLEMQAKLAVDGCRDLYQFCRSTSVGNHTAFLWMY